MNNMWRSLGCFFRSFDVVNGGSTMTNEYCEYEHRGESEHLFGPVDEDWYEKYSNASHSFVKEKLVFLRRFAKFLAAVRREQLPCESEDSFDSNAV